MVKQTLPFFAFRPSWGLSSFLDHFRQTGTLPLFLLLAFLLPTIQLFGQSVCKVYQHNGKPEWEVLSQVNYLDSLGRITKSVRSNHQTFPGLGGNTDTTYFEYRDTLLLQELQIQPGGDAQKTVFSYDSLGRKTSVAFWTFKRQLVSGYVPSGCVTPYDKIESVRSWRLGSSYAFDYNSTNQCIAKRPLPGGHDPTDQWEYRYDHKGRLQREIHYPVYPPQGHFSETIYTYHRKRSLAHHWEYHSQGEYSSKNENYRIQTTLDAQGQLIEEKNAFLSYPQSVLQKNYNYEGNRMATEVIAYDQKPNADKPQGSHQEIFHRYTYE